jgi:hypothetical protein
MKIHPLIVIAAFALLASPAVLQAAPKALAARKLDAAMNRFLPGIDRLPEADQQKLRAARDQALTMPPVQAAIVDQRDTARDFQNVLQSALLAADPKIEPLLGKLKDKGRQLQQVAGLLMRGGTENGPLADLTDNERQQLLAAFKQARQNPDVSDARQRMMDANGALMKALHTAMEKADPTITPLLAQLTARPQRGERGRFREQRQKIDPPQKTAEPTSSPQAGGVI